MFAVGVKRENEIYHMLFKVKSDQARNEVNISETNLRVWHERLGHVNCRALKTLVQKGLVTGVKLTEKEDIFCDTCQIGKSHRREFKNKRSRADTVPGEVFHTDVCGKMPVESSGGAQYFLTFNKLSACIFPA